MNLRAARLADAPILATISLEVWLGTYLRRGISTFFAEYALQEFTAKRFAAALRAPDEHFIVSENDEGLDGFIRVSQGRVAPVSSCSTTEISTLYVRSGQHGRAIGTSLLKQGLDFAQTLGAASVWLATNAGNSPAIAFYLKHGFRQVGTTQFRIQDQA